MTGLRRFFPGGLALVVMGALLCGAGCAKKNGTAAQNRRPERTTKAEPRKRARPTAMRPMDSDATPIPQPYPEAWIREARSKHPRASCRHLIYKKGCAQTRTGRVKIRVLLKPDGTVRSASVVANTVHTDPKLVAKCVLKTVPTWTFRPPGTHRAMFVLEIIFADKC